MLSLELINQMLQFFSGMSIKGVIPDIFINVGYHRHLVISNSVPQHLLKLFQKKYSLIFFFFYRAKPVISMSSTITISPDTFDIKGRKTCNETEREGNKQFATSW